MVGEPCVAELVATNPTRRRDAASASTSCSAARSPVDVPALRAGHEHRTIYSIPTDRRGKLAVGPAVVSRADPAGLLRRSVAHPNTTVWVHPRWGLVRPLPVGFAKDLEGPTSDASPAGDVAFHAIRPYVIGDDPRHIHWMSSARTGEPMVRHYVDNRRPPSPCCSTPDAPPTRATSSRPPSKSPPRWSCRRWSPAAGHRSRLGGLAARTGEAGRPRRRARALDVFVRSDRPPCSSPGRRARASRTADARSSSSPACGRPTSSSPCVCARASGDGIIVSVAADPDRVAALPGARMMRVRSLDEFRTAWDRTAS